MGLFSNVLTHQTCVGANSRSDTNFEVAGSKSQNVRVFHVTLQIVCLGEDKFTFVRLSRLTCAFGANLKARGGREGNPTTSDEGRIPTAFHFRQGRVYQRAPPSVSKSNWPLTKKRNTRVV